MKKEKLKIAIDYDMAIALGKFTEVEYEPNGELLKAVENKRLYPSRYKDLEYEDLPELFKMDKWFSYYEIRKIRINGDDRKYNDKYYANLTNAYVLLKAIDAGNIELCVSPTVFFYAMKDRYASKFIEKYVTVLTVPDEHFKEFNHARNILIREYMKRGVISNEYKKDGSRRGFPYAGVYVAEASVFGLYLLCKNESIFVHKDSKQRDFFRSDLISEINKEFGYVFPTIEGEELPVTTKGIGGVSKNLVRYHHNQNLDYPPFTSSNNIDEFNNYNPIQVH